MKRFRIDVDLDWSTLVCPCGSSIRGDDDGYDSFKRKHAKHTDDGGKSYVEHNDPASYSKCFSGPVPGPKVHKFAQ